MTPDFDAMTPVSVQEGYGFAHYDGEALHVFRSTMYDYAPDGRADLGRSILAGHVAGDPFAEEVAAFLAGKCFTELPHDEVIPSRLFDTDEGRAVTVLVYDSCPGQPTPDQVAAGETGAVPHTCAIEGLTEMLSH